MGQDARVRYTKMVIQINFISLIKEKPLNKITVKELCEAAQINRATFYKYYADIFDLMDKIEESILIELKSTIENSFNIGVRKTLVQILEKMKKDNNLYITLFSENGDKNFTMRIFQMCYHELEKYIDQKLSHLSETEKALIYVYTAQGCSGILNFWISDGMKEQTEVIADFIDKLVTKTMSLN